VAEVLSTWFSLDGRLARTLGAIVRPGRLTEQYLAGHRAPYLRPFRLYLVMSLLLFSSVLALQAPDTAKVDLYIAGEWVNRPPGLTEEDEATRRAPPRVSLMEENSVVVSMLGNRGEAALERLRSLPPQAVLDTVSAGLRRVLPLGLILFLPILAAALKLLYWRTGKLYVDHLIFAVHFQSAVFLALALVWGIGLVMDAPLVWSILAYLLGGLLLLTIYLPLALRRVYRQSIGWTALKTVALLFIYSQLMKLVVGLTMLWVLLQV
jgi:hypothetical protein